MADAARDQAHKHLVAARAFHQQALDRHGAGGLAQYGSFDPSRQRFRFSLWIVRATDKLDPTMKLVRRKFCATLAGAGLAARATAAKPGRVLRAADVVAPPAAIHAFTEDGVVELKKNGAAWQGGGVSVRAEAGAGVLPVQVASSQQRLLRVRLHWRGALPATYRYLGDTWERSYGDLAWRPLEPERILPWYFLAGAGASFIACGVKTNPGAFCFWQVDSSGVTLWLDVRNGGGGVELGGRTLLAATIVAADYQGETAFQAAGKFCRSMAGGGGISMPEPLYGGNNWYYAYGNSSADDIRADTERIASYAPSGGNRPYMVVDDGWAPYRTTGPWTQGNAKFPDMPGLAADMLRLNVRPGLWFRPLTTRDSVPDSWLLKSEFSQTRFAREQMRTLDPTVAGAAEQIRNDVRLLCSWKYQILKHDFSTYDLLGRWGFQMAAELTDPRWHFADRTRTNAEIVRAFYALLREAAGKTFLLGCNTVGHLACGLFEVQRTGDDTSGNDWSRTRKMGVNTLAFRAPQQGTFFDVDADCVGLTKAIPWSLNRQWLELLARSGTPLFVSAAPDAVGSEQHAALREAFAQAAKRQPVAEPLDWLETNEPQHWRFGNATANFDWFTDAISLPL
jgi:alpha-galactosidase